jgi:hypothetical protein
MHMTDPPKRDTRSKRRRLIERLAQSDGTPTQLADELGVTLERLITLARDDRTREALDGLATLEDLRARMLLARVRTSIVGRLIALAGNEEAGELSRKACVDLLKLNLAPRDDELPRTEMPPPSADPPDITLDEDAVRALFEKLGEEAS